MKSLYATPKAQNNRGLHFILLTKMNHDGICKSSIHGPKYRSCNAYYNLADNPVLRT